MWVLAGLAADGSAETPEIACQDLSGPWKSRAGDDPGWAAPDYDDSDWASVPLPGTWEEQGYAGYDGTVWFRSTVTLGPEAAAAARQGELGLLAGDTTFGDLEVWAGGELAGRSRDRALKLPVPREEVFRLPAEAVAADGTLTLALAVRRIGWASDRAALGAPVGDRLALGHYGALADAVILLRQHDLLADLPLLILAVVFFTASLYPLLLYLRRRDEVTYLWFGLLSLFYALNVFSESYWIYELTDRRDLVFRLTDVAGHLAAAVAIQFLWSFFSRPVGRVLRLYQLSQLGLALFVLAWPDLGPLIDTMAVRFLWLIPLLVWVTVLIAAEARRGQSEARILVWGGLALVAAEAYTLATRTLGLPELLPVNPAPYGFAAVLMSMAVAMSSRFRRIHQELEELRSDLQDKVKERTDQLERRNEELTARYEELRRSREQMEVVSSTLFETLLGQVLDGKYRLEEKIGSGGNGAIYRATHLALDRAVAVKVFQPVFREDHPEASLERFRREGVSACRVEHPNAVSVLDSGISESGIAYLVMELLEGHDLGRELWEKGPLPLERCREILDQVCDVLTAAAEAGVIHRDIKPENIFLHQTKGREVVKVVDFGIAKLLGDSGTQAVQGGPPTLLSQLMGTPAYMAPERLMSEPHDIRADVFSLGVVLYEMIGGTSPFRKKSGAVDYRRLLSLEKPPPLRQVRPEVPAAVEEVVMRALEAEPAARPTPRELARQFADAFAAAA